MKGSYKIVTEKDRQDLLQRISHASLERPWRVTVEFYKKKRSIDQNDLFHVLMREVSQKYAEHYGEFITPTFFKKFFKEMFLGQEVAIISGKQVAVTRSTSDLNVQEMSDLIEQVYMYASTEWSIVLGNRDGS